MEILTILIISSLVFVANIVGTVSGFGVSTIMTPLLLLLPTELSFAQVVLFVCIIHWFHDIWRLLFFGHAIDTNFFILFGIPSIIGTVIGAFFLTEQFAFLPFLLGIFLIMYVMLLVFVPSFRIKSHLVSKLLGGGISGFTAGIFGMRGAIRSAFLTAYHLPKQTFIGTTAAISLLIDSARGTIYLLRDIRLDYGNTIGLLLFIPISFLGSWLGSTVVHIIPYRYFRLIVALFLLFAGIRLVLMPWLG